VARWVDVRVATDQHHRALEALHDAFAPLNFRLNLNPPAVGPEVEFQVEGHTELEVVGALSSRAVVVLRSRERIGEPMVAVLGPPPGPHESLIATIEETTTAPDGEALYTGPSEPQWWARFKRWIRRG
jgi:hypothetical protein